MDVDDVSIHDDDGSLAGRIVINDSPGTVWCATHRRAYLTCVSVGDIAECWLETEDHAPCG